MVDLKQLHYAVTLAKHRNFARAAAALDMSQPALSRSISGLEAELGVQLFTRGARGAEPTPFGERFLLRAALLLREAGELEREVRLIQGAETGSLRVGAGPYPAELCVAPALGRLSVRHPRLQIDFGIGNWRSLVDGLLQSRLDIAIVELSIAENEARLHTESLPSHRAVFFCRAGHPLCKERAPGIERVFSFPFVCTSLPPRVARTFYQLARSGAIDAETGDYVPPLKVDNVALAKSIAMSSEAIGMAPRVLIEPEIAAARLVVLGVDAPWLHTNYGFAWLRGRSLTPAAHEFVAQVRAVEAELVEADRKASEPFA